MNTIRTRFAPSPTGFLHLGGARTALFCWAYAKHHGGNFILRIEDTDQQRSTPAAVEAIIDGLHWLGLSWDEGPYFQTQRFARYQEVAAQLVAAGKAYPCYCSPQEVEAMREQQRQRGEKPRYDGRCRPENGKKLPSPPTGLLPAIRFKTPVDGVIAWQDAVKGAISISNSELDDLVIMRPDGSPTYNFCVAIDDNDMQISHVIRGDDHVNNTPRQINILHALNAPIPVYAHLPMILGNDGEKLSKRHGAVSVISYAEDYLPAAMLNYLARLGFSHGDSEIFSMDELCAWFDLQHLTQSAAQFDFVKLKWLNGQYLQKMEAAELLPRLAIDNPPANTTALIDLVKPRCSTLRELQQEVQNYLTTPTVNLEDSSVSSRFSPPVIAALQDYYGLLQNVVWQESAIAAAIQQILLQHALKMPAFAIPLRLLLLGQPQSPSVDAVQYALGRTIVIARMGAGLASLKKPNP